MEAALPYTRWSISEISCNFSPKVLYSCREAGNNQRQMTLDKKVCQNQERCRIEVSREFFGNGECPGTNNANMKLWLVYSCHGGTDRTTSHNPDCDKGGGCSDPGEKHHLKIPRWGGKANLFCNGGSISIYLVTNPPTCFFNKAMSTRFFTVADGKKIKSKPFEIGERSLPK